MSDNNDRHEFKEMELWEHLDELRSRLIRSFVWIALGMVVAWFAYGWLWGLFMAPMKPLMEHNGWKFIFTHVTEPFMLQLQVCLIGGLVVAIPLITTELWGFIAPGLTRMERKVCYVVFPLSIFFFALGVVTGYVIMGPSLRWFADFVPHDGSAGAIPAMKDQVVVYQDPAKYILFMVKMILAFGITFQLPLVLMGLSYVGIVNSKMLRQQWRVAIFACAAIGAVATPGGDPFSMVVMTIPLCILYVASIGLCAMVERFRDRQKKGTDVGYAGAS